MPATAQRIKTRKQLPVAVPAASEPIAFRPEAGAYRRPAALRFGRILFGAFAFAVGAIYLWWIGSILFFDSGYAFLLLQFLYALVTVFVGARLLLAGFRRD